MGNCFSSPRSRRSKGKHRSKKKLPRSRRHKTKPWNPARRGQTYIRKKYLTVNSRDYELQFVRPSTRRRRGSGKRHPGGGGQGGYVYQENYPQGYEGPHDGEGSSSSSSSTTVRDITDHNRPAGREGGSRAGSGSGDDNAGEGPSMSGAAAA
ncbi:uncharacterized protein E0L32_007844 [Thyridium curvatum]|uniref:Uncharacterized protein n=1 Tax=Thyridium curvatum TaxID=1093900 RepID=A0A507ALE6_9PEZI|nr:uncharacterized protein E0L32_007844 [Thyridium curvatum]TPX11425.1 hypothetical protein E0L32_007844 [Thyridium curvatum]